jgi:ribonuclease-3
MKLLGDLLEELPEELVRQVFTHASWSERRSDSYARLAFLGDSVLALAVTTHLYPRLEAERFGAGRLTKIRAQAVSGPSCRAVAERLSLPARLRAAAPAGVQDNAAALVETERVLASVIEAVIGACYLHAGYERTAEAVVEAFGPEIEEALEHPVDFKSALQELLARRGAEVSYAVTSERGPAHERTYTVVARVDGRELGGGTGRSKKHAEQEAAREAVERLEGSVERLEG